MAQPSHQYHDSPTMNWGKFQLGNLPMLEKTAPSDRVEAWLARAWEALEFVPLMGGPALADEKKIALIMMRVDIDSPVSVWFSALPTAASERRNLTLFKSAFTKRFASLDTLERNLTRLETIKMTDFENDISLFYNAFSLLATRVGQHRSESDLRRNFLHGLHPALGAPLAMMMPPSTQLNKDWPLEKVFSQAKHCWEGLTSGVVGMGTPARNPGATQPKTDGQRATAVLAVAAATKTSCWECGSPDHTRAGCPQFTCRRCSRQGHIAADCNTGHEGTRGDTRGGYRSYDGRRGKSDGSYRQADSRSYGGMGGRESHGGSDSRNAWVSDGKREGDFGRAPAWGKVVGPAGTTAPF